MRLSCSGDEAGEPTTATGLLIRDGLLLLFLVGDSTLLQALADQGRA